MLPLLLLLVAAVAVPCHGLQATLDADAPWIISTFDYNSNNLPLLATVRDVTKDWAGVLGFRPALLTELPPQPVQGSLAAPRVTSVLIGVGDGSRTFLQPVLPQAPSQCLRGPEAHCVYAAADPYFGGVALVVVGCVGSLFFYRMAERCPKQGLTLSFFHFPCLFRPGVFQSTLDLMPADSCLPCIR